VQDPERPLLLLVDLPRQVIDAVAGELATTAEIIESTPEDVLPLTNGTPGRRRPTVVVLGEGVTAPAGVIHTLRPHPSDLSVAVMYSFATEAKLAVLPLLFSADVVRPVQDRQSLPGTIEELLRTLTRRRAHAATQAAAQQQLSSSAVLERQLGERLLGQFLNQAPIGALMLDGETLVAWNRRAADVLDLREPDSLHRPMTDLFPTEERTALRRHLTSPGHHRGTEPDAVFERTRPDGGPQALRIAAQHVLDTQGRARTLVLAEDVTDRLHAQRKLAERTSHALLTAEIAAAMTEPGPLDERLRRCVRAMADRLGADRLCIWTLDDQNEIAHTTCADGDAQPPATSACLETQRPLVEHILTTRRPHLDIASQPDHQTDQGTTPQGSFAGYPLISGEELIGVLTLTTRLALPGSTQTTLGNIADQIAVGTQQDRLLHRLHQTTRALERPLLPPRLPHLPGYDLAARYAPYGQGLHIGGDFYDAFTAPDGRHILVLGDVCGKGPHAAAITGLVRHTLWAAAQHSSDPGHVLKLVNAALRRQNTPFCTLIYAVLDPSPSSARLRIACAGHPAPLLRRADGHTVPLEIHGSLLGVLDEPHHPVTELELQQSDTLVLYTDGFTEGAGAQDQRTTEDLATLITTIAPTGPADTLVGALLDDARHWWGDRLRDDLAVLALAPLSDTPPS
jgi:serine phosphatase RsbU (regulator of sigma subunit)/PAS domain-containing protein